ncbi:MAG: PAS domain S-box protein [Bacteroidia bacterium]|nr:PAS domain S-box protein [Bacteroidia bacterium]
MNNMEFNFSKEQFNRIFPFYFLLNEDLELVSLGTSLEKICPKLKNKKLSEVLTISRPTIKRINFFSIVKLANQLISIEIKNEEKLTLRGQFEFLKNSNEIIFLGTPWFASMDEVANRNLTINDFAYHDSHTDLLHVLKDQEVYAEDLRGLLSTIYDQKVAIRRASKEFKRLSLVARANEDGVMFLNTSGEITWTNESLTKLSGYSAEEIKGHSPFRLFVGEQTDKELIQRDQESILLGNGFTTNLILYKKDRTRFWAHFVLQPLRNELGELKEFFGIIQDITEDKAREEKLKILSQMAEENINAVVIADAEGRINWINESFVRMTGYTSEEVMGKKPGSFLQGPETDTIAAEYLSSQIKKGEPFNTEIVNYTKSGVKYWVRIQGQPIKNDKNDIIGFFALEEEITKEKENERRFQKALENIGDNVWEHDFTTGITYFSKSENAFLGYPTDELIKNQQLWRQRVHRSDIHKLLESEEKVKQGLVDNHNLEYRIIRKDGSVRWVLDRGAVIEKDSKGKPLKMTGIHTDITSTKHLEAELGNRVKQFQTLSANVPGVIFEFEFKKDGREKWRYISPAIERIFGINPNEIENYINFIPKEQQRGIIKKIINCQRTLEALYAETKIVVPGQPIRWHSIQASYSYQTEAGEFVYTGFMVDITERKNAEQKLEEQRKFYEDILNNMPAEIAVFNAKHEYLFVNPMSIRDDKLRKWIIGKRDEDYCELRKKPLSLAQGRRTTFNKVVEAKIPSEWEERNIRPNGDEQYVLRRWFPVVNKKNQVVLVIGYGIDITERKKFEQAIIANEEKYRGIIENMNLGLMEMDRTHRIDFANQTLLKMTGLTEEKARNYDVTKFFSYESAKEAEYIKMLGLEGVSKAYEIQTKVKGRKGWWFISTAPKFAPTGELVGSVIICLDITNQKKLEHELIKSRERAETLSKAKDSFLANMSHEIRTPMNAIIGMGNQLAKTNLDEKQGFFLNTINTAAENLLVLINDILDLSKIKAGKLSVENIHVKLNSIVNNVIQMLVHKASEKGIDLKLSKYDSQISTALNGDPYRLTQILLNLMSNAIKFTEKGSVEISCEVQNQTDQYQIVLFKVKDTGLGMEKEFIAKIFDQFSQEYESVSRKFGGTGLGMSICKELVELMGGEIFVESEKGVGTTVSFTIKFKRSKEEGEEDSVIENVSGNFLENKVILVADDNDMNRLVAATILENYGAKIMEAATGEEAVNAFDLNQPDLVLMDIQMPVMNGYEATQILRKTGKTVPIIALTANAIIGEKEKCISLGMNDYIAKPYKEEEMVQKLVYWLNAEKPKKQLRTIEIVDEPAGLYDLTNLIELGKGNKAFLKKMVKLFCDQTPDLVLEMKRAYTDKDLIKLGSLAHKLKPSIDNLNIHSLKSVVRSIENFGKENNDSPELPALLKKLSTTLAEVITQLKGDKAKIMII